MKLYYLGNIQSYRNMWNDFTYLSFLEAFSFPKCNCTLSSSCTFAATCTAPAVGLLLLPSGTFAESIRQGKSQQKQIFKMANIETYSYILFSCEKNSCKQLYKYNDAAHTGMHKGWHFQANKSVLETLSNITA